MGLYDDPVGNRIWTYGSMVICSGLFLGMLGREIGGSPEGEIGAVIGMLLGAMLVRFREVDDKKRNAKPANNDSWFGRFLNSKRAMLIALVALFIVFLTIEWFVPAAGFLNLVQQPNNQ